MALILSRVRIASVWLCFLKRCVRARATEWSESRRAAVSLPSLGHGPTATNTCLYFILEADMALILSRGMDRLCVALFSEKMRPGARNGVEREPARSGESSIPRTRSDGH